MEAIALSRRCFARVLSSAALALVSTGSPLFADREDDIRTQISNVATSLTSDNAADAMAPFDKSFVDYAKLSGYFQGLTVFQLENEVDVTDEEDTEDGAKLTIAWALTLTDVTTNRTDRRKADINVRLILRKGKWRIVEFGPIDIFNPLPK